MKTGKMLKNIKKMLAVLMIAAMAFTSLNVGAVVDFTAEDGVLLVDFNDGTTFGGCSSNAQVGDSVHKNALKITPTDSQTFAKKTGLTDGTTVKDYMLSFDYMAPQTDHIYKMMFRNTKGVTKKEDGSSTYYDFAHVYFDQNGKIILSTTGQTPYNLAKDATFNGSIGFKTVADYKANEWGNITAVFHPNNMDTTIDWYVNGKFMLTQTITGGSGEKIATAQGVPQEVYIASTKSGLSLKSGADPLTYDGTECLYIDNLKGSYCETYDKFYVTDVKYENSNITLDFNETISAENTFSNVAVKNLNGDVIKTGTPSIMGDMMYIPVNEAVSDRSELTVVFPEDFVSVTGKKIGNNAVCFTAPTKDSKYNTYSIYKNEFNSETDSGRNTFVNFKESTNKVFKRATVAGGPNTDNKDLGRWNTNLADYNYSDKVYVSADFYFDSLVKTDTLQLMTADGKALGSYYFDQNGNFVVISPDAADTAVDWTTIQGDRTIGTSPTYKEIKYVSGIETGKWYTVTAVMDYTKREITYLLGSYTNNVYSEINVGTVYFSHTSTDPVKMLRVYQYGGYGMTEDSYYYIDNFEYGFCYDEATQYTVSELQNDVFTYEGALADQYAVTFDVTTSSVDLNANKIYVKNTNGNKISMVRTEGNGSMGAHGNGPSGWWWPATENWNNEKTADCGVEAGKPYNVTVLVNKALAKESTYVNGVFVDSRTLTTANLGTENNPFDVKSLQHGTIDGVTYSISNGKILYPSVGANEVKSIRIIDSSNEEFSIYSNGIYSSIEKIKVEYAEEIGNDAEIDVDIQIDPDTNGQILENVTAVLSADKKSVEISLPSPMQNGVYRLSISVTGAKAFVANFTVDEKRELAFSDFALKGETASVTAKNPSGVSANFTLIIAEYTNEIIPRLIQTNFVTKDNFTGTENVSVELVDDITEGNIVKAFIWDGFTNIRPLVPYIQN